MPFDPQILAMVLGQKDNLSPEVISLYRDCGVSHVLALSGLHLAVFCTLFYPLILLLRRPRLLYPSRFVAYLVKVIIISTILSSLWLYVDMVHMPMSLARAAVMYSLGIIALAFEIEASLLYILLCTILIILMIMPGSEDNISFQLSCAALLGIATYVQLPKGKHSQFIILPFVCQIFTLPLSLHYFHTLAPLSIPLSYVVVPLTTLILYLSFPLVFLSLAGITLTPMIWLVNMLVKLQNYIMQLVLPIAPPLHDIRFSTESIFLSYIILLMGYFLLKHAQISPSK